MYLRTFRICEIYNFNTARFSIAPVLAWQVNGRKKKSRICHATHRYAKANNKCMKDYDKNKELSCTKYLHVNKLYGLVMPKILPVDGFMWAENNLNLIKI